MFAAKVVLLGTLALLLLIVGVGIGRYSVDNPVSTLPTRLPATPVNYLAMLDATHAPYGFPDGTATPPPSTLAPNVTTARNLYETYCAHCHGYAGEGEPGGPNPHIPDALGYMPVPRHDSQGHTWLHPDQLLVAAIKQGSTDPLYRYQMPAFDGILQDGEIAAILAYIRRWWTPEQREQQAAATERLRIAIGR